MWGRLGSLVAMVALFALLLPAAPAQARPVVLMLHGGGFWWGEPSMMDRAGVVFEQHGYKAVAVPYRLGNVGAAWEDVRAAAASYPAEREVFAYGQSAGGGLAGLLSRTRLVDGVGMLSPIVDLTEPRWQEQGERFHCTNATCLARYSALSYSPRSPVRALVPENDELVDPTAAVEWDLREDAVRANTYPGAHCGPTHRGYEGDVARLAGFFTRIDRALAREPR